MFSMASLSGFLIGAIFGGIEPIRGSLSPEVSGDASNVEDNNSCMYSRSFVSDVFFTTQFCATFFVAWVLFEPQL